MTLGDKIRNMTNEELAELFDTVTMQCNTVGSDGREFCKGCIFYTGTDGVICTKEQIRESLNKSVEDK